MTTSQKEENHILVSIYPFYLKVAKTERLRHKVASADLEGYKLRSKSYNRLIQSYGYAHLWLPAPAMFVPTSGNKILWERSWASEAEWEERKGEKGGSQQIKEEGVGAVKILVL